MHTRRFLILFLAALTLFCPYLPCRDCCADCRPSVSTETVQEVEASNCCEHCVPEVFVSSTVTHDSKNSAPLTNDCPSPKKVLSCFCGGAVVANGVDGPDPAEFYLTEFLPLSMLVWGGQFAQRDDSPFDFDSGGQFPPTASGRDICALAGCFLL